VLKVGVGSRRGSDGEVDAERVWALGGEQAMPAMIIHLLGLAPEGYVLAPR
jgi:hypothetical protein